MLETGNQKITKIENRKIKKEAGNKPLLLLLLGCGFSCIINLCIKAIGITIFSTPYRYGVYEYNESLEISKHLEKLNFKNLKIINAEVLFLNALKSCRSRREEAYYR
jgi:GMP synthase PP-ATPase subunit